MINKKKAKKPAAGIGEKAAGGGPAQIGTAGGEPEDRVRLPAILGVRPGVYLAWIYSLVILGILFFALVYPGLSRPGSIAVLRSEPAGAAVRVDGVYRGTAPRDVFVLRGKRVFEFVLPGFTSLTVEAEIPGRVFASVFVPHRQLVRGTLEAADPLEPLVRGAAEFAEWSLAGEPTAVYQIPLPLSEGAYRGGPAARDPAVRDAMNGVLDAALRFTVTRAGLRDFLRAKFLVDNGGLSPSPVSALASARGLVVRLAETPGAAAALAGYLPPEAASALKGSAWYAKALPDVIPQDRGTVSSRNIEVGGISFVETAGGSFVTGGAFPRRVSIEDFYLAAETVPPSSWEAFLAANPRWGLQHAAVLREQGLVTEDYLVPFSEGPPDAGISAVSWYAAEAYGEWLTAFLPPALSSYEVRLPTEAEWEYAIGLHGGIRNPAGSLWEWCKDLYAPLDMLPAPEEAAARVGSPERSLRGGSWINQAGSGDITARASLPPRFCSPFVSFRPVIALKKGASYE
ncbi:MAG: SUMF1/EgtB/PvdO family nonheme iron enzyme [Treponema sp.]|jgi:formylglycine-generating enzyme required for sulfatase activity|nr:SUMF1/EgtB/PvdO family nonheme iron enzyme [Treponema sp.]